jgi:hypothetical protein
VASQLTVLQTVAKPRTVLCTLPEHIFIAGGVPFAGMRRLQTTVPKHMNECSKPCRLNTRTKEENQYIGIMPLPTIRHMLLTLCRWPAAAG